MGGGPLTRSERVDRHQLRPGVLRCRLVERLDQGRLHQGSDRALRLLSGRGQQPRADPRPAASQRTSAAGWHGSPGRPLPGAGARPDRSRRVQPSQGLRVSRAWFQCVWPARLRCRAGSRRICPAGVRFRAGRAGSRRVRPAGVGRRVRRLSFRRFWPSRFRLGYPARGRPGARRRSDPCQRSSRGQGHWPGPARARRPRPGARRRRSRRSRRETGGEGWRPRGSRSGTGRRETAGGRWRSIAFARRIRRRARGVPHVRAG